MDIMPLVSSFVLVTLAEYNQPGMVFLGMMLAFVLVTGMGVVLGATLLNRLPAKYIRVGSSAVFLLFDIAFLISSFSGITLF
ncbi:MAG: TMEM165/GDT1 family protein [Candidatus Bathyarchaeia archaeon]